MTIAIVVVGWAGAVFLVLACVADARAELARAGRTAAPFPHPRAPRAAVHHPKQPKHRKPSR